MKGSALYGMITSRPGAARMDPAIAAFFKEYLANEKASRFGERVVLNSHLPPFPSPAFDSFLEQLLTAGTAGPRRQLYSVTLAVTNRCTYRCWHCYNAGRSSRDVPLETLQALAAELQDLGAIQITLTGGEPLLRDDVEEIAAAFGERASVVLGTTGDGLTPARARALRESGVFGVGVSLDSADEAEHDRRRGRRGAWRTALAALGTAAEAGLYPYVVAVATRDFLERGRFFDYRAFAGRSGAREVHLLEPSATGWLADRRDVLLTPGERALLFDYQREVAAREDLPVLSCFAYLESERAFGCGAGLTHLYVDGSGEVCPCNLVPLSFGNASREPLRVILERMGRHFRDPRPACVGCQLEGKVPAGPLPAPPDVSEAVCSRHLPEEHALPRFFQIRAEATATEPTGRAELRDAYDRVHDDYETFWLKEAAAPIHTLVDRLGLRGGERVFEAGCGTGYATARIAARTGPAAPYLAVDLSGGMLSVARERLRVAGLDHVRLRQGDALAPDRRPALEKEFLERLGAAHPEGAPIEVTHEYVSCVARRPQDSPG